MAKNDPKEFVEAIFEEDFLGLEYMAHLEKESEQYYDDLDEEFEENS